jgi:phosphatidylglycerophosphatase A
MFIKDNYKKFKNNSFKFKIVLIICMLILGYDLNAQCAMCRASLEGSGNENQAAAVNDGIVYLMIIPYILAAILGFAVFRMFKKTK